MKRPVKLECRWCKRRLEQKWRNPHELLCLLEQQKRVALDLSYEAGRVEGFRASRWYRERWRELPGKGWGALAGSYQLLEVLDV